MESHEGFRSAEKLGAEAMNNDPDGWANVVTSMDQLRARARGWSAGLLFHLNDVIASVMKSLERAEQEPEFVWRISVEEMEMLMVFASLGHFEILDAMREDRRSADHLEDTDFDESVMDGT